MHHVRLPLIGTVAAWREHARRLAANGIDGAKIIWSAGPAADDLFASDMPALTSDGDAIRIPRAAVTALETALCHSDPGRFSFAYSVLTGLHRRTIRWPDRSERSVGHLLDLEKAVRRDLHKMHAFVRFREVDPMVPGRRAFAAWFEPDHHIVEAASPFFARRFGDMDWVIATPGLTARFNDGHLVHEVTRDRRPPPPDASEALWRTYFASIFNPARLMVDAMTSEMPKKYWKNLPEADLIPGMIRQAAERTRQMQAAMPSIPPAHVDRIRFSRPADIGRAGPATLASLKKELDGCRRCPLAGAATQAVCGEGPDGARIMIVGEQPGDMEDLVGRPFAGPAGKVLDTALSEAGLRREDLYVTNAVKHFKFVPRGKRRIHQRPDAGEVTACKWWLNFEIATVGPRLLVAMGSTAALALTGDGSDIGNRRGNIVAGVHGLPVLITYHPSFILRARAQADVARRQMTMDLEAARDYRSGA